MILLTLGNDYVAVKSSKYVNSIYLLTATYAEQVAALKHPCTIYFIAHPYKRIATIIQTKCYRVHKHMTTPIAPFVTYRSRSLSENSRRHEGTPC